MSKTLEEIKESKAKEYGFKSFKDLEESEHGSDPHWNVREDIVYTYVENLESQTQELQEQNAELVGMLEDMETAWQSLPYGHNSVKDTQNWISNIIHPQILRMREWVSKHKTNTLKSNTNGSI